MIAKHWKKFANGRSPDTAAQPIAESTARPTRYPFGYRPKDQSECSRFPPDQKPGYRGRFAPSPTGELHFGSLVAALASALQARQAGGEWLIRVDDIDPPREVKGACTSIVTTLKEHGFRTATPVIYQSQRHAHYRSALELLQAKGLTYVCDCSRTQWRNFERSQSDSQRCPGDCAARSLAADSGAVRFKANGTASFVDRVMGRVEQNLETEVGDFVLLRRDGLWAYQLANVVDDAEDGITEIVRGADLLDNTPRQITLARALGVTIPDYVHIPVAVDAEGQKLSKQTQAKPMNPAQAVDNLQAAWRFLGQAELPAIRTVDEFWQQAVLEWKPERIPALAEIVVPAQLYQSGSR